ncbi:EAL domain-containing protein [Rhizosaccharibacter radicis]|uniref:EAL domain-containing protein n=1 Tax=Rhizosaccharibacter radicis TaxID=2782605 RepID=A0ABT1W141_9PROT|nr:EAL domain-containing protein [Acetobacteraceae bacterium KSS12]
MDSSLLEMPVAAVPACDGCRGDRFSVPIRMAFQPIVGADGTVFAQEALVRGPAGEGAGFVLSQITDANRYAFDQTCRTTAIETAAALGLGSSLLSINFNPNAIYEPARCLRTSVAAIRRAGIRADQVLFEIVENEKPLDPGRLRDIVVTYQAMGFKVALDDFGTMHANLDLFTELRPDVLKIDMKLVRGIDADPVRRAVLRAMVGMCAELDIRLVAEGIETVSEFDTLRALGVSLFQGFLLGRPVLDGFHRPTMPH